MFRTARRIRRALGEAPLTEVWFAFETLRPWSSRLTGKPLASVSTLGKALLLGFPDGETIYTHNQLYGRWMFSDPDRRPETNRSLRLALSTESRSALLYSASEIDVIEADALEAHPFIRRAGLDVLSSDASTNDIAEWLAKPEFGRRGLGHLLLDQGFLAGIGNYLRSEILFVAGLPAAARLNDLNDDDRIALADAVHALMWRSVKTGGVTNDPERVRQLKAAGWKRRDYRHHVFSRAGQACFGCDGPIERETFSGRRLYWCPRCQPPSPGPARSG